MNENDRFEIVNRLYYRETGHLRPGKDDPLEDTSSKENIDRFKQFCLEGKLLDRALLAIHERDVILEDISEKMDYLEEVYETMGSIHGSLEKIK